MKQGRTRGGQRGHAIGAAVLVMTGPQMQCHAEPESWLGQSDSDGGERVIECLQDYQQEEGAERTSLHRKIFRTHILLALCAAGLVLTRLRLGRCGLRLLIDALFAT